MPAPRSHRLAEKPSERAGGRGSLQLRDGSVKPDQRLYTRIRDELDAPAHRTLYVGDGGGDELRGALAAHMTAVAVRRRGPSAALAFGDSDSWSGPVLDAAEQVPAYLAGLR